MLRKNINLGNKKEIPRFTRNDSVLGFFGVATEPRGLAAQRPPISIYKPCHSECSEAK